MLFTDSLQITEVPKCEQDYSTIIFGHLINEENICERWLLAVNELENRYDFIDCLSRFETEHTEDEFEQLITCQFVGSIKSVDRDSSTHLTLSKTLLKGSPNF